MVGYQPPQKCCQAFKQFSEGEYQVTISSLSKKEKYETRGRRRKELYDQPELFQDLSMAADTKNLYKEIERPPIID